MKMTQKAIEKLLEKVKECFELEELHTHEYRDKYGALFYIEELRWHAYKKDLEKCINELISSYKFATSNLALTFLNLIAEKDNHYANYLSLREYEIVRVRLLENNWFGVEIRFKDNGEIRNFIETGLSSALLSGENMSRYYNSYSRYFTAGGLKDQDVDFIFHGVGFSTKSGLYSFGEEESVIKTIPNF